VRRRTDLVIADERAQRGHEPLIVNLVRLHLSPLGRGRCLFGLHVHRVCLWQRAVAVLCCRHGGYFVLWPAVAVVLVVERRTDRGVNGRNKGVPVVIAVRRRVPGIDAACGFLGASSIARSTITS
jgi:hypothetical protein